GASKTVVLIDGGQIGDGMNNNEHRWRVRRGALEFLAADGKLWSRFKLDRVGGRLAGTTDSDVRSLFGQYLFPQHREAPEREDAKLASEEERKGRLRALVVKVRDLIKSTEGQSLHDRYDVLGGLVKCSDDFEN